MTQLFLSNLMWLWFIVMVVCIITEALTFALTTIWPALAAFVMIFISKTNMPFKWQVLLFLVISIALILTTRPFALKKLKLGSVKTNVDSLEGQEVIVTKKITRFEKGLVKAKNGVVWSARSLDENDIEEKSICIITAVEGNTLTVESKGE